MDLLAKVNLTARSKMRSNIASRLSKGSPIKIQRNLFVSNQMFSILPSCERQSFEGKNLKNPPIPRQRLFDLDLVLGEESAFKWGRAETN